MRADGPGGARAGDVAAWCSYDFANSSFTTVILTVAFSPYFIQHLSPDPVSGNLWYGRLVALSMLIVGVMAPVLGVVADAGGHKRRFLVGFGTLCILATAALAIPAPGQVWLAGGLFVVAAVGFASGNVFYNAFLPEIASAATMGRISGFGWAAGYVGGMASLLLCLPFLEGKPGAGWAWAFVATAAFYLVFALPSFLLLRDAPRPGGRAAVSLGQGVRQVLRTLRELRRFPELVKFMVPYLLYNDAISTIIVFAGAYATQTIGFDGGEITRLFIVLQITAILGAFGFGHLTDRIGGKHAIAISLGVWIGVVLGAYLCQTKAQYLVVGLFAGLGMGASQTASRTLFTRLVPGGRATEFFGLQAVAGKFSEILGPIVWGEMVRLTGSQRPAVLAIGVFFLLGLSVLLVDERKGIAEARAATP